MVSGNSGRWLAAARHAVLYLQKSASIILLILLTMLLGNCGGSKSISLDRLSDIAPAEDNGSHAGLPSHSYHNQRNSYGPEGQTRLLLSPDVQTLFVDFSPAQYEVLYQSRTDISVKLKVTDPRPERLERLKNLRIGKFEVNGRACAAALTPLPDGLARSLHDFVCSSEGVQKVVVTLYDDEGRYFAKSWAFEYYSTLPAALNLDYFMREEDGEIAWWGYQMVFDHPLTSSFARELCNTANWDGSAFRAGGGLQIESISVDEGLANVLNFLAAASRRTQVCR